MARTSLSRGKYEERKCVKKLLEEMETLENK
jgi:hypothetical protein